MKTLQELLRCHKEEHGPKKAAASLGISVSTMERIIDGQKPQEGLRRSLLNKLQKPAVQA